MAFLHSDAPREPFLRAPSSVLWLIAGLVAIHLVVTYAPMPAWVVEYLVFIPSRLAQNGPKSAVALVAHIFIHDSWTSLIMNCLWLLAFGPILARRYGTWLFLAFFILCGMAGGIAEAGWLWSSAIPLMGASSAISGLMAAAFRLLRWPGETPGPRLAPILSGPILIFSAVWLVPNLAFELLGMTSGGVSNAAGYLVGLFGVDLVERLHLARARWRLRA